MALCSNSSRSFDSPNKIVVIFVTHYFLFLNNNEKQVNFHGNEKLNKHWKNTLFNCAHKMCEVANALLNQFVHIQALKVHQKLSQETPCHCNCFLSTPHVYRPDTINFIQSVSVREFTVITKYTARSFRS